MTDLKNTVDVTSSEEYERLARMHFAEEHARREKETEENMKELGRQLHAFVKKEAQLQRIEDKLDQILTILEKAP
ncbi:hypothetical protein [Paracoccus gahaiensis]|nr:hypothetical protein [Paracoccus gahaiensis]